VFYHFKQVNVKLKSYIYKFYEKTKVWQRLKVKLDVLKPRVYFTTERASTRVYFTTEGDNTRVYFVNGVTAEGANQNAQRPFFNSEIIY
jgi:hypothetical protein